MLITIVTINRNNAEGLERTIRSVLEQADRATFEYVVIDGASTDGSLEVIDKYKEQLDFHLSEPDHGIYNAMNKSLEHVHGKYVLFLNSGDTLASTDVIRQVTNYGLTADIYFGFWRKTSEDKKYKIEGPTTPVTLYELQYNSRVCHQATITATSILRELGGYNEHYRLSADAIFLMQALVLHRCTQGLLPIVIANYDICGVSASNDDKLRAEHAEAFSTLFPALQEDYEHMHSWMRFHPKNMIRHIRWRFKKIFS
jgi:glycosyltransferase involved in cell wall biosynthesis